MSRLAQLGVFIAVLGGVILFLALFPFAVGIDRTPGFGIMQLFGMVLGLFTLISGAYLVMFSVHRERPRTLMSDIGVRLGMTGLVFSAAATMADVLGFGSHTAGGDPVFGWFQALGMLIGFLISALLALFFTIYMIARRSPKGSDDQETDK